MDTARMLQPASPPHTNDPAFAGFFVSVYMSGFESWSAESIPANAPHNVTNLTTLKSLFHQNYRDFPTNINSDYP